MNKTEAAEYLGVSERTIHRMTADGRLPTITLGTSWERVRVEDLDRIVAKGIRPKPKHERRKA